MAEKIESITKKMKVILFTNARDEIHIKEWAVHHLLLGFDIVYIFDHRSQRPIRNEFQGFKNRIVVERCNMKNPVKIPLMKQAVRIAKSAGADWMLYLDADEFLILNHFKGVKRMLLYYNYAHSIGVNWLMFGTNHHVREPHGLILENYTKSDLKLNHHVKTFARPQFIKGCSQPHNYHMVNGCNFISVNHEIMSANSPFNQIEMEYYRAPAYVAHYVYQSEESYVRRKLNLPSDDNGTMRGRDMQIHEKHNGHVNLQPSVKYAHRIKHFLYTLQQKTSGETEKASTDESS
jgi:hypothetical protein